MSFNSPTPLYRLCDALTEGLIYFAVVFGPWAFGTTQTWSIHVMNGVGLVLGLLWLLKLALRIAKRKAQSAKWESQNDPAPGPSRLAPRALQEHQFTRLLGTGTFCILLYCLVSAVNARAIYHPDQWNFEYRPAILWLPHSYDRDSSWAAFWKYLALAGLFWALRDWLLGGKGHGPRTAEVEEKSVVSSRWSADSISARLPARLRRLFWVLTANGAVLAIQGLMQRVEGGNRLLWLVVPHINNTADAQFGPYAYRSNAAQYFNLLWPAVLGFWRAGVSSLSRYRSAVRSARQNRLAVLLPCVMVMAICPLVSSSRGGTIVMIGSLIMAGGILLQAQWRKSWQTKAGVLLGLAGVVGGGALLGWQTLAPRMEQIHEGYEAREGLYLTGHYMAQDNTWLGTGPGTFATMYQLYFPGRMKDDEWLAQMHNDWLETLITFGRVGAVSIFLTLALVLTHWFRGGGIYGNKNFVMLLWVALGGCLVHAAFDFPLQVHSVLTLFLVLCAVLSCLTQRESGVG